MDVVSIKTPFIIYVREGGREKKEGGGPGLFQTG